MYMKRRRGLPELLMLASRAGERLAQDEPLEQLRSLRFLPFFSE